MGTKKNAETAEKPTVAHWPNAPTTFSETHDLPIEISRKLRRLFPTVLEAKTFCRKYMRFNGNEFAVDLKSKLEALEMSEAKAHVKAMSPEQRIAFEAALQDNDPKVVVP